MKALKNFSRKFSKILRPLIEMRGQKITGKKLKIIFLLIFILCNVTQNYHNRKSV